MIHAPSIDQAERPLAPTATWEKAFKVACYLGVAAIIAILFAENFVFSAHFGLLGFREIDDIAFQTTLRRVHLIMQGGSWSRFWEINDYAYGWLFWAPMAVVTYPFFLLSQHGALHWPLIVLPRQISLAFAVLSLLVARKVLLRLSTPEWAVAGALLVFALFPTFGYFSLRFGTVHAVMFFSLLSFYLALRDAPSTPRGRVLIALALGAAGGIKLSGLLILPLVVGLVLLRLPNRRPLEVVKSMAVPALVLLGTLVAFTNPALLTWPVNMDVGTRYWQTLSHFMEVTKIPSGPADPIERFITGTFGTTVHAAVALGLVVGMLWLAAVEKRFRLDIALVVAVLAMVAAYLIVSVKNGTSAGSYFTAVSFLLLLGIAGFSRLARGPWVLLLVVAVLFGDAYSRVLTTYTKQATGTWNHLYYYVKADHSRLAITTAEQVEACIRRDRGNKPVDHVLIDFSLPSTMNALSYPTTCVSIAWDNLSPDARYCDRPVDYLVLDMENAVGALTPTKFDERVRTADPKSAANFRQDRASREALAETGRFGAQVFAPLCEHGQVRVYRAAD